MSRHVPFIDPALIPNTKKPRIDPCDTREGVLRLAKLALVCKRYDFMFQYMRQIVEIVAPNHALSDDERQYFGIACLLFLQGQRDSYDHVKKAAALLDSVDQRQAVSTAEYMQLIATEISDTCSIVTGIIDVCFVGPIHGPAPAPSVASVETRVYFKKMKGDFLRWAVDAMKSGPRRDLFKRDAYQIYMSAMIDGEALPWTNPIRLELLLNLAKLQSEIQECPYEGYTIARKAFDMASQEIDLCVHSEPVSEATNEVMKNLRKYLDIWKIYDVTV